MKSYQRLFFISTALFAVATLYSFVSAKSISITQFGLQPNTGENASPYVVKALEALKNEKEAVTLYFPQGRYDFHEEGSFERTYYISNHDQDNPKRVAFALENHTKLTIEGNGSDFIFHGRMIPFSLLDCNQCTLSNLHIDFEKPHIAQIKIIENDLVNKTITYEVAPWVDFFVRDGQFFHKGENWEISPFMGIAFEEKTKRIVYRTSDISTGVNNVTQVGERLLKAPWDNPKLIPGTVVAMRTWHRPTPGIFISTSKNTYILDVKIHYTEGMGILAQMSENITLKGSSVCLRGADDPRYFTTQADATHFSGCKGMIHSTGGLYEGMMDDALNVHGTYLKVVKRINETTLQGSYMHSQAWGFVWGYPNDKVQFVASNTMELVGKENRIKAIRPIDQTTTHGAKTYEIEFEKPLDPLINEDQSYGIENLSWTPKVVFSNNTVRNNRARGILVSTPKKSIIENNLFDHTSGTAILLCGDCNGWYETGACRDVTIRNNRFINALTNMFQFTNAIISIYPEIPNLKKQQKYFHGGKKKAIRIENNLFETFDNPILYAKSVDGLLFKNNTISTTKDYPAFHPIKTMFLFERVVNDQFMNNTLPAGRDLKNEIIRK